MSLCTFRNVVLIGGTGNLGSGILKALLADPSFNVTILSRQGSSATFPEEVRVVKTDYTENSLVAALKGQDAVVSAVGGAGFLQQKPVVEAAVKAGVKRFIPAEFSSNTMSEAVRDLVPLFEQKKEVLDQLKTKEPQGLTWTGIAVGGLFDWGLESGFLGFDLKTGTATIWDDGETVFSLTNMSAFSEAIISILRHPNETANKYLYIASVTATQNQILAALEHATGKQWTTKKTTTETQRAMAQKLLSEGNMTGILINVQASAWGRVSGIRSNFEKEESLANDLLGLGSEGVQATIDRVTKDGSN